MKKLLTILIILFSFPCYAGMQDLSTFTESDTGSCLTVTDYRARAESCDNETADTSLYKADTVAENADFTDYFTFGFDTVGGTSQWCYYVRSSTNSAGKLDLEHLMAGTDNAIAVCILDTGSVAKVYIHENDGGTTDRTANATISEEYRYRPLYGKIFRDVSESTITVTIYREPARINVLYTITLTGITNKPAYSYVFAGMNGGYIAATPNNYTETDPGSKITVTSSKVNVAALPRSTSYVYKDFGASYFNDFTINWEAYVNSGSATYALGAGVGIANAVATIDAQGATDISMWFIKNASSPYYTGIMRLGSTNSAAVTISADTLYYCTLSRSAAGDTVTLSVYTDSARTTHTTGSPVSLTGVGTGTRYRYAYAYINANWSSGSYAFTGYTQNISINGSNQELLGGMPAVGYTNTINAFSSELYLNETPPQIFCEEVSTPLMYAEDYDGFSGFPDASHEAWTDSADGSATIAEASIDLGDGDGKSVLITGVDGADDGGAYFTVSNTTLKGGMLTADIKVTALGASGVSRLIALTSSDASVGAVAYVQNVSGTLWFRVDNIHAATSAAVKIPCELNTVYSIALIYNAYSNGYAKGVALVVNGRLADSFTGSTTLVPARVYIGYTTYDYDTHKGGTRYIDNLKYMNGTSCNPSIARGGFMMATLVASFNQADSHGGAASAPVHFLYSVDNGANWSQFHSISVASQKTMCEGVRWNPNTNSWFFFIKRNDDTVPHMKLYGFDGNFASPTVTEIYDYDDDSKYMIIYPTRIFDDTGKLWIGMEYHTSTWDSTNNYLTSALIDLSNGAISQEYRFAQFGDIANHQVSEPMLWKLSDGRLGATIRLDINPWGNSNIQKTRYRISDDLGASDWYTETLNDPGEDMSDRVARLRAFIFRGTMWVQGRADYTKPANESAFVAKLTRDDMKTVSEMYWESNGEAGNGDIDACSLCSGNLYLDLVTDMFSAAWYKRLDTGEVGRVPRNGFINFQNPGIN